VDDASTFGSRRAWVPVVDVFNRDGDLVVRAELPGIDPEKDAEISVQDGVLTIRGERRHEDRSQGNGVYRVESSYGAFERTVPLPQDVKEEDMHASYENGILEVVVPKAGELTAGKRIPIEMRGNGRALTTRSRKR
jgi:HSP20 family protein